MFLSFWGGSVNVWYENVKCAGWHWGKTLTSIPIHCSIALDLDFPCLFLQIYKIIFSLRCFRWISLAASWFRGVVWCFVGDNATHATAAAAATAGIGIQVIHCQSVRRRCRVSAVTWLTAGRAAVRICWERRRYLWHQVARNTSRPTFRFDFDLPAAAYWLEIICATQLVGHCKSTYRCKYLIKGCKLVLQFP